MAHPVPGPARCTLVIPAFNAVASIDATVTRLRRFVARHPDWRVLFVCDGGRDGTAERLYALIRDAGPALTADVYADNRGKGFALRRGLTLADTPFRLYTDVDLAYDPDEALKLLALLEAGADLAVVNRASPESRFLLSPRDFPTIYKRHLMSRAFNWWLRLMLPIRILDTQAGLKGLTAGAWQRLAPLMKSEGFFFDVELLARAGFAGMTVRETPVVFRYVDPTTVRMIAHGWPMIFQTLALRAELRRLGQARSAAAAAASGPAAGDRTRV